MAAAFGVAVVLSLLPVGASANHLGTDPSADTTDVALDEAALAAATPDELRAIVADLGARNDALAEDNVTLQRTVDELSIERDELAGSLERFDEVYDRLEADRQLLVELRKDLADSRPEAEAQLERMRTLALLSDPAGLGQTIDRVEESAPAFLDWRFTEFSTADEATQAYIDSGASAFDTSMTEFRNEVLLSVANRLDGLLTVIDRIR
jgi:hypothetical protein